MTLPLGTLVLLLVAPFLAGVLGLRLLGIGRVSDPIAWPARAWLLGAMAAALLTWVWILTGKPIDGRWLAPGLAAVALLGLWWTRARELAAPESVSVAPRGERLAFWVVMLALCGWITVRLFALNVKPVLYGDEANIFAQKAKAMYSAQWIDAEYLQRQHLLDVQHADYPLFDPLLHAWVYAGAGRITLVDNRWPIHMFTFALLFALAAALRRHVRPLVAAALTTLFFGLGIFELNIGPSRAEMLLLTAFSVAVDAWAVWSRSGRPELWRLACVALAATLWAKNEGALMVLAFGIAVLLGVAVRAVPRVTPARDRASRVALCWLLVPVGLLSAQIAFNRHLGVRNDLFDPNSAGSGMTFWERMLHQLGERWWTVLDYFGSELVLAPSRFGLLIPAALLACALRPRAVALAGAFVPMATALIAIVGYAAVFLATPYDLAWHMPTAADRTVLHVVPVTMIGLAAALSVLMPRLGAACARAGGRAG